MTLKEFVTACGSGGVKRVVMRRTSEVRPVTDEDGTTVKAVRKVVLLAYASGTLLKHETTGSGIECMPALSAAGLRVKLTEDHKFRCER